MKKSELIKKIVCMSTQSIEFTKKFSQIFEDVLIDAIENNKEFILSQKLRKFVLKSRNERTIISVRDKKKITIPARPTVIFKIYKTLKDHVKDLDLNKIKSLSN